MMEKAKEKQEKKILVSDVLEKLKRIAWCPEYKICLGWFVAIPWMREIQKRLGMFPILWISGQAGTGKTTLASFLMGLYYPLTEIKETTDTILSLARTTPKGLSRVLTRHPSLPVLLDDIRMDIKYTKEYIELMCRKKEAALVTTSQHPPKNKALSQCALEIELKKAYLKNDLLFIMRIMIKDLYPVGRYFKFKALNETLEKELDMALEMLNSKTAINYKLQAFAVACAGLLKAGFSQREISMAIPVML